MCMCASVLQLSAHANALVLVVVVADREQCIWLAKRPTNFKISLLAKTTRASVFASAKVAAKVAAAHTNAGGQWQ